MTNRLDASRFVKQADPAQRVLTVSGYGIRIDVERGHLRVIDGIASERRERRIPRVERGTRRLVVLGRSGTVSLDAFRWMHDVGLGFIQIDNDGTLLSVGTPNALDDVRVRRGQALAASSAKGLDLVRELLDAKTDGQMRVLAELGGQADAQRYVAEERELFSSASSISELRYIESRIAVAYWSAWADLPVAFPARETRRIPRHWLRFGPRRSLLTPHPRKATGPANAMLNYLYAVVEAEARLAALRVGLDPAMGLLHLDRPNRESFACDLMEAVRPRADQFLLDTLRRRTFLKSDFFETTEGSCRLMPEVAAELSRTSPHWARLLAPVAERAAWAMRQIEPERTPRTSRRRMRTPLTQANRTRPGTAASVEPMAERTNRCRTCGRSLKSRTRVYCDTCLPAHAAVAAARGTQVQRDLRAIGQDKRSSAETRAKHRENARRNNELNAAWESSHATIPSAHVFEREILPQIRRLSVATMVHATGLSTSMCKKVRDGSVTPHPRHWNGLRTLVEKPS
jgi:CRISPR-associated endonuclease Cas1